MGTWQIKRNNMRHNKYKEQTLDMANKKEQILDMANIN